MGELLMRAEVVDLVWASGAFVARSRCQGSSDIVRGDCLLSTVTGNDDAAVVMLDGEYRKSHAQTAPAWF